MKNPMHSEHRILSLILGAVILSGAVAKAEESYVSYYDPSSSVALGAGFDWNNPRKAFVKCLEHEGVEAIDTNGAIRTEFSVSLVKSRRELYEKLKISASASGRSLFYSGSAHFSALDQYSFDSDSVVWMIQGSSDYGRYILKNPRLKSQYQALLERGNNDRFAKSCGTHFVQQERRMTMIAAIFSIERVSDNKIHELKAGFQAAASSGFFSGQIQASYESFFRSASQVSQVKISVFAIGGEGITKLSDLAVNTGDLAEVQKVISAYMKGMTPANAMPIEYIAGSMESFGYALSGRFSAIHKERTLAELFYLYKEIQLTSERLREIIFGRNTAVHAFLGKADIAEYQGQYDEAQGALGSIFEAAQACQEDAADCHVPSVRMSSVDWPINKAGQCEFLRLSGFYAGIYGTDHLQFLRSIGAAPVFRTEGEPRSGMAATYFCEKK